MSKHNKQLKDYAGMTLEEALLWVEEQCGFEKDRRRLRSRMVGHLLAEEIKKLRAEIGLPVYTHDCTECTFLGTTVDFGDYYDLYYCKGSIIVRFSNRPSGNICTENREHNHPVINFGWYLFKQKFQGDL